MKNYLFSLFALLALSCNLLASPRQTIPLNDGWTIKPMSKPQRDVKAEPVTLPHTWNAEYIEGTHDYNRETMVYQRPLEVTEEMLGKRLFLYFEGVNSVADVFVNRRSVGNHKGGYTAFCMEITDFVTEGENELEVWASNGFRSDVLPLSGDFNVYGGIHRPVRLIVTPQDCLAPDYFASPGAILSQSDVSAASATLDVKPVLSLKSGRNDKGLVTYDRQTRKDAFYFYKAQWNPAAPMLHLCSARYTRRDHPVTDIRAYATTAKRVTLYLNGKKYSTVKPDHLHRAIFQNVTLAEGKNTIEIKSNDGMTVTAVWTLKSDL